MPDQPPDLPPDALRPSSLPTGTVTFLFSDIEGSTKLLQRMGERYGEIRSDHERLLRQAWADHRGHEVDTQGAAFARAMRSHYRCHRRARHVRPSHWLGLAASSDINAAKVDSNCVEQALNSRASANHQLVTTDVETV